MFKIPVYESASSDFDFLFGKWVIHHKRLKERLKGSSDWIEFDATHEARSILGGLGNVDEMIVPDWLDQEFRGVSIRLFHPDTKQWSIYWVDNIQVKLDVPVLGGFKDGVGRFYTRDEFKGQPILVRFLWLDITKNSARWEQAFSADEGKIWETNWIMEFERIKE